MCLSPQTWKEFWKEGFGLLIGIHEDWARARRASSRSCVHCCVRNNRRESVPMLGGGEAAVPGGGGGAHRSHPQKWQGKRSALGSGQVQARPRLLSRPNHSALWSRAHRRTRAGYLLTRRVPVPLQPRRGRRNVLSGLETV